MLKPAALAVPVGLFMAFVMPSNDRLFGTTEAPKSVVHSGAPVETRVQRSGNGHFYVHAMVNGQLVRFVVDTGATGVALTEEDAERVGVDFSPRRFRVIGTGASGDVRGQLVSLDSVDLEGKVAEDVDAAVLEGLEISLLGQSYLSRISGVEMSGDYMRLQ